MSEWVSSSLIVQCPPVHKRPFRCFLKNKGESKSKTRYEWRIAYRKRIKWRKQSCQTLRTLHNQSRIQDCTVLIAAPKITGGCSLQSSSSTSLTFAWTSAKSATMYRLIGNGVDETSSTNTITVDSLTPGTLYTFTVWAVAPGGLTSNNITCVNSTGIRCYKLSNNWLLIQMFVSWFEQCEPYWHNVASACTTPVYSWGRFIFCSCVLHVCYFNYFNILWSFGLHMLTVHGLFCLEILKYYQQAWQTSCRQVWRWHGIKVALKLWTILSSTSEQRTS